MKKLKERFKNHIAARQLYQLKRTKWNNGSLKRTKSGKTKRSRPPNFIDAKAPEKFNLQPENVENVLSYIGLIKDLGRKKKDVNLILEDVDEIGIGAISMLISVMQELSEKNIYLKGVKPINEEAKNILEQSGFMRFVNGKISDKNRRLKNIIFTTGKANTHQRIIVDSIHKANHTIWGQYGRSPLLYGILLEMIKNSCKHAFKSLEKVRWHIAVNHDEENRKVKFSFVDNGIGIIRSFEKDDLVKYAKGIVRDNIKLVQSAFEEGIESKTGLPWRGTGLPTIHESLKEDGIISNLVVITNDVYFNFDTGVSINLNKTFSGTYYYWEMDRSCEKHCFE